jgi:hypothetical protein
VAIMLDQESVPCQCRDHKPSTLDRPALFVPLVLIMFGSLFLLFALTDLPFGVQIGSLVPYTAFVVLATFSAQRGQQPYFFECSIVRQSIPQLVRRHGGFLVAVIVLETISFRLARYLPTSWLIAKGKSGSLFAITVCVLILCLAFVQVLSNRSLLERAHQRQYAPA